MATANNTHITVDDKGTARIGSTRHKVIHLAGEHYYHGWTAEEILRQHPDLRPEEVYSALAWFYDHYAEMVRELKETSEEIEAVRAAQPLARAELFNRKSRERR